MCRAIFLLMQQSLEATSITGEQNYGRTDRSGWPCFNFCISNGFSQNINFLTYIFDCDSHSQRWIYFYRLTQIFFLQWLFLYCEILIMLWPQCQLTFLQIQRGFFYVFYNITYAFRVKLHSNCLNVKKLLARNSRDIWIRQQDSDPQPLSSETNTQPLSQIWQDWLNGWVFVYEVSGWYWFWVHSHVDWFGRLII